MTRDHFKQVYSSPYFQSDYYKDETRSGIIESKMERIAYKIKSLFKFKKK